MNLQKIADPDPWSIHKLVRDETRRMDLGSVGRVRDCTGSGPLVKSSISEGVRLYKLDPKGLRRKLQAASAKLQA